MKYEAFRSLVSSLTADISARRLDATLAEHLTRQHPPGGEMYDKILAACRAAIAAGWMCNRQADGIHIGTLGGSQTPREGAPLGKAQLRPTRIRYGRVIKPGPETHGFSVDVVEMRDCAGPHHVHPNGEIDLVMPLDGRAAFDGQGAGWKVYEAGSDHVPTVRGGRALVLYLLPGGAIQFTGRRPEAIG